MRSTCGRCVSPARFSRGTKAWPTLPSACRASAAARISLFGSDALKARYLPPVCAGRQIPAFALSEQEAGSDVSAMNTTAVPDGAAHVRIDGMKTWISNGGIADFYVVFARSGEAPGARGISAFVVDADNPGLSVAARIDVIAPHPLATLRFEGCRVPLSHRLGAPGAGFKVAMATLDIFRSTVAAAALGLGRRAQHEALHRAATRQSVRWAAGRSAADAGRTGRQRGGTGCRGPARLPRRLDQGQRRRAHQP